MENKTESCCSVIHTDIVENVRENMPSLEVLYDLAEIFKTLGDSTRIRIVYALMQSEMCVCDISALLSMSQSAVSHQLKVMRSTKIVKHRKSGKTVFYSLDDNHIKDIIKTGMLHVTE